MPYIKNDQIFRCPNDPKFWGDKANNKTTPSAVITVTPGRYTYYEALGQSYKFTKDNFTLPREVILTTGATNANGLEPGSGKDVGDMSVAPAGTAPSTYSLPPVPMVLSYFARPSETRVIRDFNAPWEAATGFEEGNPNEVATHKQGINIAFADGHVKFVTNKTYYLSLCDGPTLSPARNLTKDQPFLSGDGSCNTSGQERKSP